MAGSLEGALAGIPGYGAYVAKRQMNEEQGLNELRRASGLQGLLQNAEAQKAALENRTRIQALQQDMMSLPEEQRRDPDALTSLFTKHGFHEQAAKYAEMGEARKARTQQVTDSLTTRLYEIDQRMQDRTLSREQQANLAKMADETKRMLGSIAGMGSKPYFQPVQSAQGVMSFDSRTGKMAPAITPGGQPIIGSASDPSLQGDIAGAKFSGEAKAKRAMNMAGIGEVIDEAEALLSGSSGKPLPTGSGTGAVVDFVGGLVGMSPSGAAEAQTLKAIGGALTLKMPRMEGPQSDRDTALYKEMSAVVGDATVPRPRRLAALKIVKQLWGKYESLNQTSGNNTPYGGPDRRQPVSDEPPPGAVRRKQ